MNRSDLQLASLLGLLVGIASISHAQFSIGTAFSYQGSLNQGGAPATGQYDFEFELYDAGMDPSTLVAGPVRRDNASVSAGLFSVLLDFGSVFEGDASWLSISVRVHDPSDTAPFMDLTPRVELAPVPYAVFAARSGRVDTLDADQVTSPVIADGTIGKADLDAQARSQLDAPDGDPAPAVMVDDDGNVGIGTLFPDTPLEVSGVARFNSAFSIGPDQDRHRVEFQSGGAYLRYRFLDSFNDNAGVQAGRLSVGLAYEDETPPLSGAIIQGNVGIGTDSPAYKLDVNGTALINLLLVDYGGPANEALQIGQQSITVQRPNITADISNTGGGSVRIGAGSGVLWVGSNGAIGVGTTTPAAGAKLDVAGRTQTNQLTIDGGADIAEPFSATEASEIEPGMVLCIDPEREGGLRMADQAYDPTVLGVVSGAGGINTGMSLTQDGLVEGDSVMVALTGRVYVLCDAEANGPIRPGDRLTTSATPGHAMRATDREKADGTTIGKAMGSLEAGKGLVLVFVALQ